MENVTKKQKIELTYNGFHGRKSFTVFAVIEKPEIESCHPQVMITISKSAAQRINRIVGCKTHKVVFGSSYPIPGACGCGEGLQDISGRPFEELDDVTIYTTDNYEYRGRYPQKGGFTLKY